MGFEPTAICWGQGFGQGSGTSVLGVSLIRWEGGAGQSWSGCSFVLLMLCSLQSSRTWERKELLGLSPPLSLKLHVE